MSKWGTRPYQYLNVNIVGHEMYVPHLKSKSGPRTYLNADTGDHEIYVPHLKSKSGTGLFVENHNTLDQPYAERKQKKEASWKVSQWVLTVRAVQFSSGWYLCAQESPSALHPISQKFPQHCLSNCSNVCLIDDGPLLSFQGRLSSASSVRACLQIV